MRNLFFFFAFFFISTDLAGQMFDQLPAVERHAPPAFTARLAPQMGLTFLGGFLDGVGDKMQFKYSSSVFYNMGDFWDPSESWRFKYRNYPYDQRAKFPGSKTVFVFATDGWHLSKTLSKTCYEISIVTYRDKPDREFWGKVLDVAILKTSAAVGWHLADIVLTRRN